MGTPRYAEKNERGWKDTFKMYPGEVSTVIVRFAPTYEPLTTPAAELLYPFNPSLGPGYVWHCHIVDHEDNEMMRPHGVVASPYREIVAPVIPGNELVTKQSAGQSIAAEGFALEQNYPNPVTSTTEIRYTTPVADHVQMKLYNNEGRVVQTLIDAEVAEGTYTTRVDGTKLTSGVYFYQIQSGNYTEVKKMLVVK
jgi:hypothetical protein